MAGYSGKTLAAKLGLKAGLRGAVFGAPDSVRNQFRAECPDAEVDFFPDAKSLKSLSARKIPPRSFLWYFCPAAADLEKTLPRLRAAMPETGQLWISWPKKSATRISGVERDPTLTEHMLRGLILAGDLVDVKICAVDEIWSALKVVVRRSARRENAK